MPKWSVTMEDDTKFEVDSDDKQSAAYQGCRAWIATHLGIDDQLEAYCRRFHAGEDWEKVIDDAMEHDMAVCSGGVSSVRWIFTDPSMS